MTLSDRKLEKKEEAMPTSIPKPLLNIMEEYLNGDIQVSSTSYVHGGIGLTIFGKDVAGHTYQKALAIAQDFILPAAPLDQLVAAIKQNPNVLLPTIKIDGMEGTLLQLAIIRLDQTICENKGMAEMLMDTHAKYLPNTVSEAIEKARHASFFEEKDGRTKELKQIEVLNRAFNTIKQNKLFASRFVKNYIDSIKPTKINNRCYYLDLLQLHYRAFDLFARKGNQLTDSWYGTQGNRFCFEVGGTIQKEMPDRIRQILINGTYQIFNQNKIFERVTDRASDTFFNRLLGVNFFYNIYGGDETGIWGSRQRIQAREAGSGRYFSQIFEAYTQPPVPAPNRKASV